MQLSELIRYKLLQKIFNAELKQKQINHGNINENQITASMSFVELHFA